MDISAAWALATGNLTIGGVDTVELAKNYKTRFTLWMKGKSVQPAGITGNL